MLDDLSFPVIVVMSSVLTVVPPIIRIVSGVECCCRTPAAHPTGGAAMGKGNYALGLGETDRVGVRASVVFVVAPLAVVTISANWTFPDGVGGVKLFAKAAAVREWEGSSGAAGWHLFIVVLGIGVPPETVVTSVLYSRG